MKRLIVLRVALCAVGASLLYNAVHVFRTTNRNLGTLLILLLGVCFVLYGLLLQRLRKWKWLHITVAVCCIFLAGSVGALEVCGTRDNATYHEDAALVLGCGIKGDTVTASFARRLDAAVRYHEQNPTAVIVVSGGQGAQETVAEAEAGARYLIANGVPEERILKEERASSTLENFQYSKALLDARFPDGYTLTVITSRYHVFRAVKIAAHLGLSVTHVGTTVRRYTILMNDLRELFAIANEVRRGSLRLIGS